MKIRDTALWSFHRAAYLHDGLHPPIQEVTPFVSDNDNDPPVNVQNMQDLPRGTQFIGPDGARYKVTAPASEHEHGFVFVWNLSMGDGEVLRRLSTPGWCKEGTHPREMFFAYSHPTEVEVLP